MAVKKVYGDEPLNQTIQVRFTESQVEVLNSVSEKIGKHTSTVIREIVADSIIDIKEGIIKIKLPKKMQIEISKSCERLGVTKEEFIHTIILYNLSLPTSEHP